MKILGSSFIPVMDALRPRLGDAHELRPLEPSVPLVEQVRDVEVIILGMSRVDCAVLDAAPSLRLVHQHGRGVDGVDHAHARARGVIVANVPGGNSVAVAEHALALMFALAKQFHTAPGAVARRLSGWPATVELHGKTLGIVGLGASGVELAKRATALGLRVLATRRRVEESAPAGTRLLRPDQLPELLVQSDFISLHTPFNDETRGMIGARELAQCKKGAYLINIARAGIVDKAALTAALRRGPIAAAGFDVFWGEPADPTDPILKHENFLLTPHTAGFSDASIAHVCGVVVENLGRLSRGEPLTNVVTPT